jgi:hypothetical protein
MLLAAGAALAWVRKTSKVRITLPHFARPEQAEMDGADGKRKRPAGGCPAGLDVLVRV